MSDKPRRAWFQIHLSTAILMMFVAGGLMWANVVEDISYYWVQPYVGDPIRLELRKQGWPIRFTEYYLYDSQKPNYWKCAADFATALVILAAIAFVCEYFIRRREARAP
jgi:hypothetical protein